MEKCGLDTHVEFLQRTAQAISEINSWYLCQCVGCWLKTRPGCGVKQWLEHSIRRSTHRLAPDGLQETIARLGDEDLLWLYQNSQEVAAVITPEPRVLPRDRAS